MTPWLMAYGLWLMKRLMVWLMSRNAGLWGFGLMKRYEASDGLWRGYGTVLYRMRL
jgi:hypothetical protein